jgi:lipopolysaccharide/colanic/teichoic acid biosynthesis glycosyltransferase
LAIKSGMTGFAQASGSSDLPFEEEIKLDTYYIENWSLLMDLKIFLKTLVILFRDRSAC